MKDLNSSLRINSAKNLVVFREPHGGWVRYRYEEGDWLLKVPVPCVSEVLPTNTSAGGDAAGFSLCPYGADRCSIIRTTTMASSQDAAYEDSREKHDHVLFHRHLLFRKRGTQAALRLSFLRGNIPSFS